MKHLKRAVCVVLLLCLLLTGCGGDKSYTEGFEAGYQAGYEAALKGQEKDVSGALAADDAASAPQKESDAAEPSAPAEPVTVVLPVDLSAPKEIPANALPDLHYWSGRVIGYADEPSLDGSKAQYIEYGCKSAEGKAIFLEYLEALQQNGWTLVEHYKKYGESWGFLYDAAGEDVRTVGQMYTDTPCHFTVYNDGGIMRFILSTDITVCDTGLRRDGTAGDLTPQGPSAGAGLIRLPDGSYQTSDGRLTASVGTATVLRDGTAYTTAAEYAEGDTLHIDGYYRNESIFFRAKAGYLMEGDILTQREMRQWKQYSTDKGSQNSYKYDTVADLSVAHNGEWRSPSYASLSSAKMDVCTARVMYMDDGGDAVFYFYARFFEGEPKEIEALCAVSTADDEGAFGKATYIGVGDSVKLNYPRREYGSDYHTFDWELVEGDGKVALDAVGDTCTVTALKPGTAIVRVSYGYSVEQADVLTGTPRTASRHKSETYYFVIE